MKYLDTPKLHAARLRRTFVSATGNIMGGIYEKGRKCINT